MIGLQRTIKREQEQHAAKEKLISVEGKTPLPLNRRILLDNDQPSPSKIPRKSPLALRVPSCYLAQRDAVELGSRFARFERDFLAETL
jgi:hypothetical protein